MFRRDCPVRFWPFAMEERAYIKNRVPAAGKPCAPLTEMFPGQVSDLSELRVFGCSASLSIPKSKCGGKSNPVSVPASAAAPAPKGGL